MRILSALIVALGVLGIAAPAVVIAGDPIPGADIYLEQEPHGEPIAASDCSGLGGIARQRVTDQKWVCDMRSAGNGTGGRGVIVGRDGLGFITAGGGGNSNTGTGSLVLVVQVINDSRGPAPQVPFVLSVRCRPNGPARTVTLNSANGYRQTVLGIPVGGACTTTELLPPTPAELAKAGCRWEAGAPDAPREIKSGEATTRTIINHWTCK